MLNRRNYLIAIDLGNTSASYGLHNGTKLIASGYVLNNNIPKLCHIISKSGVHKHKCNLIISSVVPSSTKKLAKSLEKMSGKSTAYIVGKNIHLDIPMRYNGGLLGSDRLVNIYGGLKLYKPPLLIVDFGTAITFDYISKKGIFEGGLIIPGVEVSYKALQEKAALLPKNDRIKPIKGLVGRDTKTAMNLGLLNGFGALSDGLIDRFKKRYGSRLTVLGTGGFISQISSYTQGFDYVDPLHTIRSLILIYQNEIQGR